PPPPPPPRHQRLQPSVRQHPPRQPTVPQYQA
ncbi:unnamed protein product, partial [Rotaria socialis]